ncbi:hypothetical protein RAS2_21820 [Phycisphaerae bacterium RAS2]|nr:hypothetical protein RAS2_21820 [Phycisphaerae bacterium RAS2]
MQIALRASVDAASSIRQYNQSQHGPGEAAPIDWTGAQRRSRAYHWKTNVQSALAWVLETQVPAGLSKLVEGVRGRLAEVLGAALAYHLDQFRAQGRPVSPDEAARALSQGRFAARPFDGCNLWHDIMLAVFLSARDAEAVALFRARFKRDLQIWAGKYACGDAEAAEDFLGDLLLPREKSGPRIDSYKGHAPLVAWLKQVFRTQADRRRLAAGPAAQSFQYSERERGGSLEIADAGAIDPADEYAAKDCRKRLMPMFRDVFSVLTSEENAIVKMSLVDHVPGVKIGQLLGMRDYQVTRVRQSALEKLRSRFLELASTTARLSHEAVKSCVELLLNRRGLMVE